MGDPARGTRSTVAICVPTYRRLDRLLTLVKSLNEQTRSAGVTLVIGNNDPGDDGRVRSEVGLISELPTDFITVHETGVVAVRNALVSHCLEKNPSPDWVAFIDDDETADPEWIGELLSGAQRTGAELVGGPVELIPAVPTIWARCAAGRAAARRRPRTPRPKAG